MSFSKSQKLYLGLGAITGVATFYFTYSQKSQANASWTTSYTPSPFSKWDENWDHRSPSYIHTKSKRAMLTENEQNQINEEKELSKPRVCRHIILIRHGQYNLNGTSDEERTLTKLGRIQAGYTGARLKELGFPYTSMIKSTMARAQETGSIISQSLPNVPVTNCDLLREGAPIPPEPPLGRYKPEVHKFFQDGSRIEAGFRKYFYRADPDQKSDTYTLLVCHANVIRYFICRALQFPAEGWLRLSLNHASITWITITPSGRCVLRAMGDTGHMPPDAITST